MTENKRNESDFAGDAAGSHALNTTKSTPGKTQDVADSLKNAATNQSEEEIDSMV